MIGSPWNLFHSITKQVESSHTELCGVLKRFWNVEKVANEPSLGFIG